MVKTPAGCTDSPACGVVWRGASSGTVSCCSSIRVKSAVLPLRLRFTAHCHGDVGLRTVTWGHLAHPMSPDCPPDPNSNPILVPGLLTLLLGR